MRLLLSVVLAEELSLVSAVVELLAQLGVSPPSSLAFRMQVALVLPLALPEEMLPHNQVFLGNLVVAELLTVRPLAAGTRAAAHLAALLVSMAVQQAALRPVSWLQAIFLNSVPLGWYSPICWLISAFARIERWRTKAWCIGWRAVRIKAARWSVPGRVVSTTSANIADR